MSSGTSSSRTTFHVDLSPDEQTYFLEKVAKIIEDIQLPMRLLSDEEVQQRGCRPSRQMPEDANRWFTIGPLDDTLRQSLTFTLPGKGSHVLQPDMAIDFDESDWATLQARESSDQSVFFRFRCPVVVTATHLTTRGPEFVVCIQAETSVILGENAPDILEAPTPEERAMRFQVAATKLSEASE